MSESPSARRERIQAAHLHHDRRGAQIDFVGECCICAQEWWDFLRAHPEEMPATVVSALGHNFEPMIVGHWDPAAGPVEQLCCQTCGHYMTLTREDSARWARYDRRRRASLQESDG